MNRAHIDGAQLQGAFLNGANLEDARLEGAQLQGVSLILAQLERANLRSAQLQGATLSHAEMQGADLSSAKLTGADLGGAQLQGAKLDGAQLHGAKLDGAQLQGASLETAQLDGARLVGTQLQGARLEGARFHGALLDKAKLQGAVLNGAHLEGATLTGAVLHGARFDGAYFEDALLEGAQLHGVEFRTGQMAGAMFDRVFAWRARAPASGARVIEPKTGPIYPALCEGRHAVGDCDWKTEEFIKLKQLIEEQVPSGPLRDEVMQRIERLDPATPFTGENEMAKSWAELAQSSASQDGFEEKATERLRQVGCAADAAPYVIRGLLRHLDAHFEEGSRQPAVLAAAFLDEAKCPGARGLSEDEKGELRAILDRAGTGASAAPAATAKP
jgi:uncharacterized protein YjbI with pentapeptide repeats